MVWWPELCGARRDFVDDQFMRVADDEHFHRQHAHIVQFVRQPHRHLPRLGANVRVQTGGHDGIGQNAVFVDVFRRVVSLHVVGVQTADDHGNFAAQIHRFFQHARHAAQLGKRGFGLIDRVHADLAFAVVAQRGGFQDARQQRRACVAEVVGNTDGLIRRGLQTGGADALFFQNDGFAPRPRSRAWGNNRMLREQAHRVGVDVFKLGGYGGALGQFRRARRPSSNGAHKWRSANAAAGRVGGSGSSTVTR